jgi:carboxymethylenebutenolidase
MISLTAADGFVFGAYRARPTGLPRAGLVLVMEIFGVTEHIKELCDGYAHDGFEVISPALYDRIERNFEAGYSEDDIKRAVAVRDRHSMADSIRDVQASLDFLAMRGHQTLCMTGYCYGGSVTWVAAARCRGLTAASAYYGRLIKDHLAETPRCPTILHFGEKDQSIPLEWVHEISAAYPQSPVYVYPAGHGFNSDRRRDYDDASARLARRRTLEHFTHHIGKPSV